jgi:hypothetical protein
MIRQEVQAVACQERGQRFSPVADAARLLPDVQVERGGVVAGERARDVKSPARRSRAGLTRFVVNLGNAMAVLYLLYFLRD